MFRGCELSLHLQVRYGMTGILAYGRKGSAMFNSGKLTAVLCLILVILGPLLIWAINVKATTYITTLYTEPSNYSYTIVTKTGRTVYVTEVSGE